MAWYLSFRSDLVQIWDQWEVQSIVFEVRRLEAESHLRCFRLNSTHLKPEAAKLNPVPGPNFNPSLKQHNRT